MFYHFMLTTTVLLSLIATASAAELPEGVRRIKVLNYPDCFELSNTETRVTLCHQVGGRVLEYSFKGTNALLSTMSRLAALWRLDQRVA